VFVLAQHLDRRGDAVLEPLGITTKQWLLLAVLARRFRGRRPTLTEAAAAYGSSRQNVKAIAEHLAAAGFLRLTRDPTDRRGLRLEVTRKTALFSEPGWAATEAAFFDAIFAGMTAAETARLHDLLVRWLGAVEPATTAMSD